MNKKIHILFFTFKIETRVMKKVFFFLLTLTLGYKALHCIYFNSNFLILHISLQNNNLSSDQSGASSFFFFIKSPVLMTVPFITFCLRDISWCCLKKKNKHSNKLISIRLYTLNHVTGPLRVWNALSASGNYDGTCCRATLRKYALRANITKCFVMLL